MHPLGILTFQCIVDYWIFVFFRLIFVFSIGVRRVFGKIKSSIADDVYWFTLPEE
jgi:hypothetical protein